MKEFDFTGKEFPPLGDVLERHLRDCPRCQLSLAAKPVPNVLEPHMTRTKLCGEWFAIIMDYAQYEGAVNNVVAHTETGTEAYHQPTLWEGEDEKG
jgi:hypothetical protein